MSSLSSDHEFIQSPVCYLAAVFKFDVSLSDIIWLHGKITRNVGLDEFIDLFRRYLLEESQVSGIYTRNRYGGKLVILHQIKKSPVAPDADDQIRIADFFCDIYS